MSKIHGIIYTLLASIAFGIMPIWVKIAYATGLTAFDVFFLRGAIAAFFLFIFIKVKKISLKLETGQIKVLLFAGIFGYFMAILSLYISYEYIGAGVATALHYLFPVFVAIFSRCLFREKLHRNKWIALIISLAGLYVMTSFGGQKFHPYGIFFAILSAITFAIYVVALANPKMKAMNSYVLAFYVCMISAILSMAMILIKGQWPMPLTVKGLFYVSLVAIFCTSVALIFFIRGVQIIGPASTSILSTLEPIISLGAGIVILGEPMTLQIILGSILVVGAILLIAITDAKKEVSPG
jgi:drug/metabolite transporter (DMT)-like permease